MLETRPRTENWTLSINLNQRNPQRGCYLALTFGTLLSSQGADARDTRPGGPSIAAAVPRYAAHCVRQAAGPGPAPGARSGGTQINRRPPGGVPEARSCWAGGAWSDPRAVTLQPSRSGLAGRREKVTWVSSGLSNRPGVTPDTRPEQRRHTPFTRFRRVGPPPPSASRGAAPASLPAASRTPPARRRRR